MIPETATTIRNKFYVDEVYQAGINYAMIGIAGLVAWFDRVIINDTGINGSGILANFAGDRLKYQQTGLVPNYALMIVAGIVALSAIAVVAVAN